MVTSRLFFGIFCGFLLAWLAAAAAAGAGGGGGGVCLHKHALIKRLPRLAQLLTHRQQLFHSSVFLGVFSNDEDDVLHRYTPWSTYVHGFLRLQTMSHIKLPKGDSTKQPL